MVIQAALVLSKLPSPLTMSFVGSEIVTSTAVLGLVEARVIRVSGAGRTGILGVILLGSEERC